MRYTTNDLSSLIHFYASSSHKNVQQRNIMGIMLPYPTTWRDFRLRDTMSTGKLKNMKCKVSHFWGEKRPTKNLRTVFQLCWDQLYGYVHCLVNSMNITNVRELMRLFLKIPFTISLYWIVQWLGSVRHLFYHDMQISWPDSSSPPIRLSDS